MDLSKNAPLIIRDSIVFRNGRLRNRDGLREITILGDIVNYSNDVGFHNQTNPSNRRIYLTDTLKQQIRGTATLTTFPQTVESINHQAVLLPQSIYSLAIPFSSALIQFLH